MALALTHQPHTPTPHRVLIVDDSKVMCAFLKGVIDSDPALSVVGCALDPYEARELIKKLNPDIITLDIEMPRMDGLTFLRNLMRLRPMPVVMISALTSNGADASLEALSLGAVDFMVKRQVNTAEELAQYSRSIRRLIRSAAAIDPNAQKMPSHTARAQVSSGWQHRVDIQPTVSASVDKIICIGASTGGPEAVSYVLRHLDAPKSAVLIAQHMPTRFIPAFAERLNKSSNFLVEPSYDGAPLEPGRCYVATGDAHTGISKSAGRYICSTTAGEKINGHQPSVDALFMSAAKELNGVALGVLLTGMGDDGARGLKAMHDSGAMTIAQDKASSAVWGMPGSAVKLGAAEAVLPLQDIASTLSQLLKR